MDFPNITLVSVAGTKVLETIDAMRKCHEQAHFEQTLLLSPKLDYRQYNEFVAMSLWKYINTDYCLIFQNDGYIIDGSKWTDEFLNYDYIGAPWRIPEDNAYKTPTGELVRVGNGGFSLRSKKLLGAPTKLGLEFSDMGTGFPHEDGWLCCHVRKELEDYGIKFAPLEVAALFSTEFPIPETVDSFGAHGVGLKR